MDLQFLWSAHFYLQRVESGRYLLRWERHIVLGPQVLLDLREPPFQVLVGLRQKEPATGLLSQALQRRVTVRHLFLAMQGQRIDLDFAAQSNGDDIAQIVEAVGVLAIAEDYDRAMNEIALARMRQMFVARDIQRVIETRAPSRLMQATHGVDQLRTIGGGSLPDVDVGAERHNEGAIALRPHDAVQEIERRGLLFWQHALHGIA